MFPKQQQTLTMNQTQQTLSNIWGHIQSTLFPWLKEELGELTAKQQQLIEVIEIYQVESHFPYIGTITGRKPKDRSSIARSFVAKAVYNMATTEILIDRLHSDIKLRRICGWEKPSNIPSQSTFSRAFAEFSETHLAERIHETIIEKYMGEQLVGHISRDSTSINAREKPEKKEKVEKKPKKRGRPKIGEERPKEITRLEKQVNQNLVEMKAELPIACNVGTKRNSKGHTMSWIGYKLHIDCSDVGIPISCILTSASLHDSQVALPLAEMTKQRVDNCYDLMDAAYDSPIIIEHSKAMNLSHYS